MLQRRKREREHMRMTLVPSRPRDSSRHYGSYDCGTGTGCTQHNTSRDVLVATRIPFLLSDKASAPPPIQRMMIITRLLEGKSSFCLPTQTCVSWMLLLPEASSRGSTRGHYLLDGLQRLRVLLLRLLDLCQAAAPDVDLRLFLETEERPKRCHTHPKLL